MNFAGFLLAMVSPMIGRILLALGFQVVTLTGMELVISTLKSMLLTNLHSLPVAALQLFALAGGGTALGMILGAIATRLVLINIEKSVRILGVNNG